MRNRKRLYRWLLVLILAGTLGGVGLMIFCAPTAGVTRRNFDRIQDGMTKQEVQAILGVEPLWGFGSLRAFREVAYLDRQLPPWESGKPCIVVSFWDGRVDGKRMLTYPRTWKERLTEWLPW
jgi:hypothetical protein